jgi:hypothetical protein
MHERMKAMKKRNRAGLRCLATAVQAAARYVAIARYISKPCVVYLIAI